MSDYRVRPATTSDVEVLVRHRIAMFQDMDVPLDANAVAAAFGPWLLDAMPKGLYHAWVIVDANQTVISGGGLSVLPWPPGPRNFGGRIAFVYNVYTEPAHRHRGLGRMVMEAIHGWCREERIESVVLNASRFGQPLYESLGYAVTASPMMFLALQ